MGDRELPLGLLPATLFTPTAPALGPWGAHELMGEPVLSSARPGRPVWVLEAGIGPAPPWTPGGISVWAFEPRQSPLAHA